MRNKRTNQILIILGVLILLLGIYMLIKSSSYQKYTNAEEYERKYRELFDDDDGFYSLRKEHLTPKIKLIDYGVTSITIGVFLLIISTIGLNRLKTPYKKMWIIIIGIAASLTGCFGYILDISCEMIRGGFPYWADSIAIPLMGTPFLFILSLVWGMLNLLGITNNFKTGVFIFSFRFNNLNYWYLIVIILTILINILTIIDGDFWYLPSGFLWLYFYISIMLGIRQGKLENNQCNG